MSNDRDPEEFTQAEVQQQAAQEPEDPHTRREEVELDRMEATTPTTGMEATTPND